MSAISECGASAIEVRMPARSFRVEVSDSIDEAEQVWAALEAKGGASAYQSRRFLRPWLAHVAPAAGVSPSIGLAYDSGGRPVALLPFGLAKRGPLRAALFLGGRDSNLNLPLVDPTLPLSRTEASAILRAYAARLSSRPDVLILVNQPLVWAGRDNPFVPAQPRSSPSAAHGGAIGGTDPDARTSRATRKKLRSKAAKLSEIGTVSVRRATSADERLEVLHALLEQKQRRFNKKGIDAGLDGTHTRAFLQALTDGREDPALELYALRVGARVAAAYGGLPDGRHWHGLINSFDEDPSIARCSPGDLLLRHVLMDLGERGFTRFDLGIGEARYKDALCEETIALADVILPFTARGHVFAAGEALRLAAKRRIKQTPWAIGALRRLQAARPASDREPRGGPDAAS